jgi:hypothetical protein
LANDRESLKSIVNWGINNAPAGIASNSSGFSGLPAGARSEAGLYEAIGGTLNL